MRASWQGYITIGQIGIPVRLFNASRAARPRFTQLSEKDGVPVERILRSSVTHEEVKSGEIIRAVEVEPGKFVTLTEQELEKAGAPHLKTIDVKQFCDKESVDLTYFEKPYYVTPTVGGEHGYALLREALVRTGKLAVTQFVIYGREHIAALGVTGDIIVLHQLRYAEDVVPRTDLKTRPLPKSNPSELDALCALMDRFSGPFYIQDYHDEHAEYIHEIVDRKARGLPMPRRETTPANATPEDQIGSALKAMLGNERQLGGGVDKQ